MPTILLVDDRATLRRTTSLTLTAGLEQLGGDWNCRVTDPLPNVKDYLALIQDPEAAVAVIILDELLNERAPGGTKHVSYTGSDVAMHIRAHKPDYPIYLITSYLKQVKADKGIFEEVLDRELFRKEYMTHLKRMTRAGAKFHESRSDELNEMVALSKKVASKKITKDESKRLTAIRETLSIAYPIEDMASRAKIISDLRQSVDKLKEVTEKIKSPKKNK